MSYRFRLPAAVWAIILVGALGFLVWTSALRLRHVDYVTGLVQEPPVVDPASATGYEGGFRQLIVPEHSTESFHWIAGTQQMFAKHEARVRHIDYDNAPIGRGLHAASLYRWWLGLVAWADHAVSGRPIGLAVENAALYAGPLLQGLFLLGATGFVAWRFGALPAALLSLGIVALFPFAGGFIPGAPDHRGMGQAIAFWSVLLLAAGVRASVRPPAAAGSAAGPANPVESASRRVNGWFLWAGIAGGVGLWNSVAIQTPILIGIGLGGLAAAGMARAEARRNPAASPILLPWRTWALSGAITTLAAYLIEYFPAHLGDWQIRAVHPVYGLAWLGGGELLAQVTGWMQHGKPTNRLRAVVLGLLALAAVAALPVVMWKTDDLGFLAADFSALRLTKLPGSAVAPNFLAWILREEFTAEVWATIAPVFLIAPVLWLMLRSRLSLGERGMIAVAIGPVLVALVCACRELSWWNGFDAVWLVLLIVSTAAIMRANYPAVGRWMWSAGVGLVALLGLVQFAPSLGAEARGKLSQLEVEGVIERDLAQWLAKRTDAAKAVVLSPPNQTTALYYFGGLRGLGTLDWENREGFGAAVRIVSATTTEEAQALITRREVTHLVLPSWDSHFDEYARLGLGQVEGSFVSRLRQWALPNWLRPVAYQLPNISGLEGESVRIFEVVDDQNDAVALSRIGTYFVEMGELDFATSVGQSLRRFPADVGALVARVEIALATNDTAGFTAAFEPLLTRLARKADRSLPWDRRVCLAVVLARGKQAELARAQVRRCLEEIDELKLRGLATGSLYRLQVLGREFGLPIGDPRLRALALELLPPEWRSRL